MTETAHGDTRAATAGGSPQLSVGMVAAGPPGSERSWLGRIVVLLSAVALLGLLEILVRAEAVDTLTFAAPSEVASAAAELLGDESFRSDSLVPTLVVVAFAFGASVVLGVVLALLMYWFRGFGRTADPYLAIFYALPIFALYPVLVLLLGAGLAPQIVIGTAYGGFVVALETRVGLAGMEESMLKLARQYGMGRLDVTRLLLLPAAAQSAVAGARIALSQVIVLVIATQFILSNVGVGREIATSYHTFRIAEMYGAIAIVFVLAGLLQVVVGAIARTLAPWLSEPHDMSRASL